MSNKRNQNEIAQGTDIGTATTEATKPEPTSELTSVQAPEQAGALESRRAFLFGLGKWSKAVIVGAIAGGALLPGREAQAGWLNRRGGWGGGWVNARDGIGWANRRGRGWGGGSWINRR